MAREKKILEMKLCIQLKQTKACERHINILRYRSVTRRILLLKEVGETTKGTISLSGMKSEMN
jgi:hypothetical protein